MSSASAEPTKVIISDKTALFALDLPLISRSFGRSVLGSGEALLGPNDGRESSNDHH